ncbi:UNVERIFIED_CONTAM: hypothetical protein FKN15_040584 [Acipenser sinensis]
MCPIAWTSPVRVQARSARVSSAHHTPASPVGSPVSCPELCCPPTLYFDVAAWPFPSEDTAENEDDVYRSLEELADEHDVGEDDIYDCVPCEDDGDDIYEDIIKMEVRQPMKMGMTEDDKRNCCLLEIQETEAKYYKTLEDIEKDLIKVHFALLRAIDMAMMAGGADGLAKIFLDFKERLLVYGQYCSHMENAQKTLDHLIATREDVKMKVEELVSHSTDRPDRQQLKEALEAMQDLAMYINEVKRDNETLKKMSEFQSSIENLQVKLEEYGRPKIDGELKVCSIVNRTKQDRYIFLFDKVVIVCKRRGYSYELKEIIELQCYKMTDDPMHNRDIKKWSYGFFLIHLQGKQGFQFFCKAEDTKRKWMEQFEMAMSNIKPERASANHHNFQMHTFEKTTNCRACKMLLRGIFYQGYYCSKCGTGAHKECLEVITICKISPKMVAVCNYHGAPAPPGKPVLSLQMGDVIELLKGDPDSSWWEPVSPFPNRQPSREHDYIAYPWFAGNMERQQADNLLKSHTSGTYLIRERTAETERFAISIKFNDEVKHIKVVEKDNWIHITEAKKFESLLPVSPFPNRQPSREHDYYAYPWFAGNMERQQADNLLKSHTSGTYLIRERTAEAERFAISIKFNDEVKHIKVVEKDNWIHITEAKKFESLLELVEYYQIHSLKESFKLLDTTLRYPYKSRERSTSRANTRSPASSASYNFSFLSPQGLNFSSQTSTPFWSVFTPKVIGTAVARYNFAARDMRELSLREGDIVKIYSKIGGDQGWWKGEANGRIGWFPSTYVDEGVQ